MAPDYQLSKIYCIRNGKDENKIVYIGATVAPLDACLFQHTRNIYTHKTMDIYKLMGEVGVEHFTIELIRDFPCASLKELNVEKGRLIKECEMTTKGCNSRVAGRSHKESVKAYHEEHKTEINEQKKMYYEANKEKFTAYQAEYRAKEGNKEKRAAYMKEYRATHKSK